MTCDLRAKLIPAIQCIREIPTDLGMRRYTLTIRVRTWSGGRPGVGTPTDSDLTITPRPRVRAVSVREVQASGGRYTDGDLTADRINPYVAGPPAVGYTPTQLRPVASGPAQEVMYILTGDEGPFECSLVGDYFTGEGRSFTPSLGGVFEYALVLRRKIRPVR